MFYTGFTVHGVLAHLDSINSVYAGIFFQNIMLSADFPSKSTYQCQTIWIQIRPEILSSADFFLT